MSLLGEGLRALPSPANTKEITMTMRRITLTLFIIAVMLATLGCALTNLLGFGRDADPVVETTPVAEVGDSSVPSGGQSAPTQAALSGDAEPEIASLDAFTSYRFESEMSSVESDTVTESLYVLVEFTTEPRASRMIMSSSKNGALSGETEMIQIGDSMYMRTGDEWLAMTGSAFDDDVIRSPYMGARDVPSPSECDNRGRETMNGYETVRYECRVDYMLGGSSALGLFSGTGWKGTFEYWLSTVHNVPVRVQYEATYTDPEGKPSTMRMESNTSLINEPIAIEAPEGVSPAGLPDDIPLIEGATDVSSFFTITTFKVSMAPGEVASWYKEAMEANGWSHDADSSWGDMLQYTKGDRSVMLSIEEAAGGSEVTIIGGDE
jgi:hypothetical protein